MRVYLDASVMVALALQEPGSFEEWLAANAGERLISSIGWGEFVDAIARRVRAHTVPIAIGDTIVTHFSGDAAGWSRQNTLDSDVLGGASFITVDMTRGLKLGDAIHLAICRRLGATLLTGDRRQAAAADAFEIDHHLIVPEPES